MGKWRQMSVIAIFASLCAIYQACTTNNDTDKDSDTSKPKPSSDSDADSETDTDPDVDTGTEFQIDPEEAVGCDLVTITNAEISEKISTVGIIEWTADGTVSDAYIEFGPIKGDYQRQAPVDLTEDNYRTLLLGMKTESQYKFRVVATVDGETCVSGAKGIQTGTLPTGIPDLTFSGASSGGFIVTTSFVNGFTNQSDVWDGALIIDEDGDYVWWYNPETRPADWVRARISSDGKYMWIANGNYPNINQGTIVKVRMDGTEEEVFSFPKRHHDLLELPFDGILAFMEYDPSGTGTCDQIVEVTPDGNKTVVFKVRDYFGEYAIEGEEWCHSNALNYVESEDAYYLSVLMFNTILKFNRTTGELEWKMGGEDSDFPGVWWDRQHQHHLLDNSILIFSNGGHATDEYVPEIIDEDAGDVSDAGDTGATGGAFWSYAVSHTIEFSFDEDTKTASLIWDYKDGLLGSMAMGDAKRLPNGNTQIIYSSIGVIQEVTPEKEKVYEIKRNGVFGYGSRRDSLYAAPPEYDYYLKR